jgi:hypothetical protein
MADGNRPGLISRTRHNAVVAPSTKKLSARTVKTRRLAQQDAANRCSYVGCRKALPGTFTVESGGGNVRCFCTRACYDGQHELEMARERSAGR